MNELGISDKLLTKIQSVLRRCGVTRAVVFGSRAKGTYRKYSDIDIAVYGDVKWDDVAEIKMELDEIATIFSFDVVGYELTDNETLREHIRRVGVPILGQTGDLSLENN